MHAAAQCRNKLTKYNAASATAEAGMSDPTKAAVTLSSAHGIGTVRVQPVNTCKLGTVRSLPTHKRGLRS